MTGLPRPPMSVRGNLDSGVELQWMGGGCIHTCPLPPRTTPIRFVPTELCVGRWNDTRAVSGIAMGGRARWQQLHRGREEVVLQGPAERSCGWSILTIKGMRQAEAGPLPLPWL